MDRRHFFQTLLSAPILAPWLLASQARDSSREVYLISDTPHIHLPLLIQELFSSWKSASGSFSFYDPSPYTNSLNLALSRSGWQFVPHSSDADLKISFQSLHRPACPSFTLVKEGKIWDVRSWNLRSLWQEMEKNKALSSVLTIASLKGKHSVRKNAELITIYMNGQRQEALSLKENSCRSFAAQTGLITVQITNGSARIAASSCRHKICFYSPPITLSGERIICAPNHFLIEVQGNTVDTVIG